MGLQRETKEIHKKKKKQFYQDFKVWPIEQNTEVCLRIPHLDMKLRVRIHVVEEFLVVFKLLVPFDSFSVTEIISKWSQQYIGPKKFGFLPVLIQQRLNSTYGENKLSGGKSKSNQNWGNTNPQTMKQKRDSKLLFIITGYSLKQSSSK